MAVSVTITSLPTNPTSPSWMPTVGQSYGASAVGNVSLESQGIPMGLASVSGTGLGIDGPNWELGYYNGQWLVHNGNLGTQPTYATYSLNQPLVSTSSVAGSLSNTGPIGLGTVGEEIAIVAVVMVIIVVIALVLHSRK